MNDLPTTAETAAAADLRAATADIDASCRWPVIYLFLKSAGWLLIGFLLLVLAQIKMHAPGMLADCAWLTYGRVRPAGLNVILYGSASQAALGVALWMLCRLGGYRLLMPVPILVGAVLWNLGVAVGVIGILAGQSTGFELFEMPRYAAAILFVAYALIGVCAVAGLSLRRGRTLYVSQWYLLAALFWFPWIYSAAGLLLLVQPVRGTLQAAVAGWYGGNFLHLWLAPAALAVIYYFVPKLARRPLPDAGVAAVGFWSYVFFASLAGLVPLVGGPVPAWMSSMSTAAAVSLLLPLYCLAANWHQTLAGLYGRAREDRLLASLLVSAGSFLLAGLLNIMLAFPQTAAHTQFTFIPMARLHLLVLGCVTLALSAAMSFIVPRLLRAELPCGKSATMHFWGSLVGTVLVVVPLLLAGWIQGGKMFDVNIAYAAVFKSVVPLIGLSTLGFLVLLVAQGFLVLNLLWAVWKHLEPARECAAEMFVDAEDAEAKA